MKMKNALELFIYYNEMHTTRKNLLRYEDKSQKITKYQRQDHKDH